jgi:hypothetical protein
MYSDVYVRVYYGVCVCDMMFVYVCISMFVYVCIMVFVYVI